MKKILFISLLYIFTFQNILSAKDYSIAYKIKINSKYQNKYIIRVFATTKEELYNSVLKILLNGEYLLRKNLLNVKLEKYNTYHYFENNIVDHYGFKIITFNDAKYFTKYLIKNKVKYMNNKTIKDKYFVDLNYNKNFNIEEENEIIEEEQKIKITVKDSFQKRKLKEFEDSVDNYSNIFNIKKDLIFSIIKAESNFNPKAINNIPAVGLMQIVPKTAGKDSYELLYGDYLNGLSKTPSIDYLFDVNNNIKHGTHYLSLLKNDYLKGINDYDKKELCIIAGYNAGIGNIFKHFDKSKNYLKRKRKALEKINSLTYKELYYELTKKFPFKETRNYVKRVIGNMIILNEKYKEFI
jgi:membrane-bound lytic murein transglycosylase C